MEPLSCPIGKEKGSEGQGSCRYGPDMLLLVPGNESKHRIELPPQQLELRGANSEKYREFDVIFHIVVIVEYMLPPN